MSERAARPRVLVVDDDLDHATMLEAALQAEGYDAEAAYSCAGARAALESRPADALVCDLTLGDGTALDLLASLGERRPRFAVVLSGFDAPEDLARARAAGYDGYLVKPTSIDTLSQTVARGLAASARLSCR